MNDNIKISIITPSYNQGKFIEQTIQSVLNQTYKNTEYIIVDGGSTDNSLEIIEKYRDKINIVISEKDKGQSDAINKGFKLATGTLSGWINSDDLLYPDCVEKIVELYEQFPNGSIYYHSFNEFIDKDGNGLKTYQHIIPDKIHLLKDNYDVIQQGSFYNTEMLRKVDYLNINNHFCMDLDLWLYLLDEGPIYCTKDFPHTGFRIHDDTKTSSCRLKFLENIYQVLNKHNAKWYHPAMRRLYYYYFKAVVRRILTGKK